MDGRRAVAKLQGEDTLPRGVRAGGWSKIKTNPLIFLCQVITLWDQIQIEIVANGLRQSAADCKGYRGDWVCVWLLEAEG